MPVVNFNFVPHTLDPNPRKLLRTSDGDTPQIEQPIRMVSVDTPEKTAYAGKPETSQPKLDRTRQRLQNGFFPNLPDSIRDYLLTKLRPDAAERHISAGIDASTAFDELLERRLQIDAGRRRKLGVIPTGEIIDVYGRLLAYIVPWFEGSATDPLPPKTDPARRTFNLDMIEHGWGVFFPIYPSLPRDDDMNVAIVAAETAWERKRGVWRTYGRRLLLGYEYRVCIKLAEPIAVAQLGKRRRSFYDEGAFQEALPRLTGWHITQRSPDTLMDLAFQRHCVDLRTLRLVGRFDYGEIPPPYRLWIWPDDLDKARKDLRLT